MSDERKIDRMRGFTHDYPPDHVWKIETLTGDDLVKSRVRAILQMMKPEWKWAAMDEDGTWCIFQTKPVCVNEYDLRREWYSKEWNVFPDIFDLDIVGNWTQSLVER